MTKHLFRGNPRLLISAAPWVLVVLAFKLVVELNDAFLFELSPLLAGAIGAEVFILGFLLNGTAGDFKEAEKLPGELAASLETIADECLITDKEFHLPEARTALGILVEISRSVRSWLVHDRGLDDVLGDIRALNEPYRVFAPVIQAGFTTRLKTEQSNIRKTVLRMDTMRRTSYVAAGYLIAEVTALLLMFVLVVTKLGQNEEEGHQFTEVLTNLALVGLISYLLIYLVSLIRDLDNPFEYQDGKPGAADVNLEVLERNEDRLRALLVGLESTATTVSSSTTPAPVSPTGTEEAVEPSV